jgi:hypothetical protein
VKIVIWGLKTDFHTHKFIHGAFYENFRKMGFRVCWVDDRAENAGLVSSHDTVFAIDVASKHLPIVKDTKYVLHNISPESLNIEKGFINLQVYTNSATGHNLGLPYVQWDNEKRTLFQPWGVPTNPKIWKGAQAAQSKNEFWVGSIWNNELNQGNSNFMEGYISALKKEGIRFIRKGTPSRLQPNGISESRSMKLVHKSTVGAAVVGNWQDKNHYIPCRLFKNIASGAVPSSNADFSELFGVDGGIFNPDPERLISEVLSLSRSKKIDLISEAQQSILPYTFSAGINRILTYLHTN